MRFVPFQDISSLCLSPLSLYQIRHREKVAIHNSKIFVTRSSHSNTFPGEGEGKQIVFTSHLVLYYFDGGGGLVTKLGV